MIATVMLCCNDDRGNRTNAVEQVEFSTRKYRSTLEGRRIRFVDLSSKPDRPIIKLGYRTFAVRGPSTPWVGNIFWDAVKMELPDALRLFAYLIERGYQAEEWTTEGPFAELLARPAS